MKTKTRIFTVSAMLLSMSAILPASAQKGIGGETGIARQTTLPEVVTLRGQIIKVDSHPCDKTTGRAPVGTHVLVRTRAGTELNIHLGPAPDVKAIADQLKPGKKLTIDGFRTDQMPENHYVAKSLHISGTIANVRDDNLRPLWAHGRGKGAGARRGQGVRRGGG